MGRGSTVSGHPVCPNALGPGGLAGRLTAGRCSTYAHPPKPVKSAGCHALGLCPGCRFDFYWHGVARARWLAVGCAASRGCGALALGVVWCDGIAARHPCGCVWGAAKVGSHPYKTEDARFLECPSAPPPPPWTRPPCASMLRRGGFCVTLPRKVRGSGHGEAVSGVGACSVKRDVGVDGLPSTCASERCRRGEIRPPPPPARSARV